MFSVAGPRLLIALADHFDIIRKSTIALKEECVKLKQDTNKIGQIVYEDKSKYMQVTTQLHTEKDRIGQTEMCQEKSLILTEKINNRLQRHARKSQSQNYRMKQMHVFFDERPQVRTFFLEKLRYTFFKCYKTDSIVCK